MGCWLVQFVKNLFFGRRAERRAERRVERRAGIKAGIKLLGKYACVLWLGLHATIPAGAMPGLAAGEVSAGWWLQLCPDGLTDAEMAVLHGDLHQHTQLTEYAQQSHNGHNDTSSHGGHGGLGDRKEHHVSVDTFSPTFDCPFTGLVAEEAIESGAYDLEDQIPSAIVPAQPITQCTARDIRRVQCRGPPSLN